MVGDDVSTDIMGSLVAFRLMAIVRGDQDVASAHAALALLDEGFRVLEISLNTPNALAVITRVAQDAPADAWIGAGTVLTEDDVHRARDAGARFMVTPAVAPSGAESARIGVPVIAGAFTPTECVSAMSQGATAIKLFPASAGGPSYVKALRDPFPRMPIVAVGGVGVDQIREYLGVGAIAVGLGGPLLGDAAAGGDLAQLRARAQRARLAAGPWVER